MVRKSSPLSFRVDDQLRSSLEDAAKRERRSVSSLVTIILSDWLAANAPPAEAEGGRAAVVEAKSYKAPPGRPRKIPTHIDPWMDKKVGELLDTSRDYTVEQVCLAMTGKPVAEHVEHYDKAIECSLLRCGWVEAIELGSGDLVWITRERLKRS